MPHVRRKIVTIPTNDLEKFNGEYLESERNNSAPELNQVPGWTLATYYASIPLLEWLVNHGIGYILDSE